MRVVLQNGDDFAAASPLPLICLRATGAAVRATKQNRPPKWWPAAGKTLIGGDGGNRTRVRKIRPPDVYKLSRSI